MGPTDTLQEIRDRLADLPERLASVLGDSMRQSGPVRGPDGRFSSPDSGSRERPSQQPGIFQAGQKLTASLGGVIPGLSSIANAMRTASQVATAIEGFQAAWSAWRSPPAMPKEQPKPQPRPAAPKMNMQALATAAAPLPTATPAGPAPVKTTVQPSAGQTRPVRSVAAPQANTPTVAPLPAKPPPLPASSAGRKKAEDPWKGYQTFPLQSAARKPTVAQPSPSVPSARTVPVQPTAAAKPQLVRQPSPAAAAVPSPVAPPRPAQPISSSPSARVVGPQPAAQPVQARSRGGSVPIGRPAADPELVKAMREMTRALKEVKTQLKAIEPDSSDDAARIPEPTRRSMWKRGKEESVKREQPRKETSLGKIARHQIVQHTNGGKGPEDSSGIVMKLVGAAAKLLL